MKKIGFIALDNKILAGETVYFVNTFENMAIKLKNDAICVIKPSGGTGYSSERSNPIVVDGILEGTEITEQEFNDF